jgi:hypothetical protein
MPENAELRTDIRQFRKRKPWYGIPLLILGVAGLIIPILPGWIFIFLGILLLFPARGERIINRLKAFKEKHFPPKRGQSR